MFKTKTGSPGNLQSSGNEFGAYQIKKICSTPLKIITPDFTNSYDAIPPSWVKICTNNEKVEKNAHNVNFFKIF